MSGEADTFDPFEAALLVRDAVAECSCCEDEHESEERFSAAAELLAWVVRARERIAVLEAAMGTNDAVDPVVAPKRRPLTPAERQHRRRLRKAGKLPHVTRHEESRKVTKSSHENVTRRDEPGFPPGPPSRTAAAAKISLGEGKPAAVAAGSLPSETTGARHEESRDERDASRDGGNGSGSQNFTSAPLLPIASEDVAAEWHRYAEQKVPGGALHAHSSRRWRTAYETIAAALNAAPGVARESLELLMRWWWTDPKGPIVAGRVKAGYATPEVMADSITRDIAAAFGIEERVQAAAEAVSKAERLKQLVSAWRDARGRRSAAPIGSRERDQAGVDESQAERAIVDLTGDPDYLDRVAHELEAAS